MKAVQASRTAARRLTDMELRRLDARHGPLQFEKRMLLDRLPRSADVQAAQPKFLDFTIDARPGAALTRSPGLQHRTRPKAQDCMKRPLLKDRGA